MTHDQTHTGSGRAASRLTQPPGKSWAQAAQDQRALLQEIGDFARDESLRFFHLRLERNEAALEKLQHCVGLPGLIGVQQEWLRDFVTDVMGQNMRLAGALRGAGHDAVAAAADAAQENLDQAQDTVRQAEQPFGDGTADAHNHMADDARAYSDVQH